jgi:hypothetical protein
VNVTGVEGTAEGAANAAVENRESIMTSARGTLIARQILFVLMGFTLRYYSKILLFFVLQELCFHENQYFFLFAIYVDTSRTR